MLWQHYDRPASIAEAIELLAAGHGQARLVAGATDLIIRIRRAELQVETLVDVNAIPGLDYITCDGNSVHIGARVTHGQAAASDLLAAIAPVLATACHLCGSPQIRNVGTLVGNVVNAQPAADATTALLALDARLKVASCDGERELPVAEACLGPSRSAVDPTREMVTEIVFEIPPGPGANRYERLSQRRALTLPVIAIAVQVVLDELKQHFAQARIALGPVAPVPFRAREAEAALAGATVSAANVAEAARLAALAARPRDSLRGSGAYRKAMVEVLVRRALTGALQGAGVHV